MVDHNVKGIVCSINVVIYTAEKQISVLNRLYLVTLPLPGSCAKSGTEQLMHMLREGR